MAGVIRRHREAAHWSLDDFAALTGLSRPELGFIEDDQRKPGAAVLLRIARVLGLPPSQLWAEAEQWLEQQPECCKKCYFCCLHRGELPWLNARRGCTRT